MDSKKEEQLAAIILLAGNIFLLILKGVVGLLSGSVAVLSDAVNSFSDVIVSVVVFFSVKMSHEPPDTGHPFGHYRAQPLAALIVAVFSTLLGFEIIKIIFEKLFYGSFEIIGSMALAALAVTIAVKFLMWAYLKKVASKIKSPALSASVIDCRNDVLIDILAVIGVFGATQGYQLLDPLAGLAISVYVIKSGFDIARGNIDYLIGKTPSKELLERIESKALSVSGVLGLNEVRAHYIGNYVQVEVHIELDSSTSLQEAHDTGKKVEAAVEALDGVSDCFVHIDPRQASKIN